MLKENLQLHLSLKLLKYERWPDDSGAERFRTKLLDILTRSLLWWLPPKAGGEGASETLGAALGGQTQNSTGSFTITTVEKRELRVMEVK